MWWAFTLFKLIRIPESGKFLLVETGILGFRILESGIQLKNPESRKRLESGIRGPLTRTPALRIRNPQLESRIQDCLGLLYTGRVYHQIRLCFSVASALLGRKGVKSLQSSQSSLKSTTNENFWGSRKFTCFCCLSLCHCYLIRFTLNVGGRGKHGFFSQHLKQFCF